MNRYRAGASMAAVGVIGFGGTPFMITLTCVT
jgi:hypothetical protein